MRFEETIFKGFDRENQIIYLESDQARKGLVAGIESFSNTYMEDIEWSKFPGLHIEDKEAFERIVNRIGTFQKNFLNEIYYNLERWNRGGRR